MSIIVAILVFGIIVLIHELGHFYAARKCGVLVEEFAIGMGPKLFSVKRNGTVYSLRVFPIGGFCKMLGEDTQESKDDERSFGNKTVWQRIIIISAGVIMNLLLAFIITNMLTLFEGFSVPTIKSVGEGTPAAAAGLISGDTILEINGKKIRIYQDMFYALYEAKDNPVNITYATHTNSEGKILNTTLVPIQAEDGRYIIGVTLDGKSPFFGDSIPGIERSGFFESIYNGTWSVAFIVRTTIDGVVRLVTLDVDMSELSGPVGIYGVIGDTYKESVKISIILALKNMASLVALLSANLGVFNLLPFPALDGGRLVFLFIESIRRKPVNADVEGAIHLAGFILLIAFAIFIASSDIIKLL